MGGKVAQTSSRCQLDSAQIILQLRLLQSSRLDWSLSRSICILKIQTNNLFPCLMEILLNFKWKDSELTESSGIYTNVQPGELFVLNSSDASVPMHRSLHAFCVQLPLSSFFRFSLPLKSCVMVSWFPHIHCLDQGSR